MVILVAGIWLAFLAWTVASLLQSTAALPLQITAWIALAAFPVVYLRGFLYPDILSDRPRQVSTLIYTGIMVALGIIMSLAAPPAIINIVSYLMALWIFNHRLITGIVAVVTLFIAGMTLMALGNFVDTGDWFLGAVVTPAVFMIFIRVSIEMGAAEQQRTEQLALVQQREDLASTVHDVLGHSLTTVTVKVQLAQRLLDTDVAAAKAELADIETLARKSLSEVRATVTDLRHPDLTEQLNEAATGLRAAGLTFHRPQPLPRLSLVQEQVFAWVIREAVTNVLRHANATTCTIEIVQVHEQMRLRIDDDGVGITDTDPQHHHGLAGLYQRVVNAGGSLTLMQRSPGTRVEVLL